MRPAEIAKIDLPQILLMRTLNYQLAILIHKEPNAECVFLQTFA